MSPTQDWWGKTVRPLMGWEIAVRYYICTFFEMLWNEPKEVFDGHVRDRAFARLWGMMASFEKNGLKDTTAEPLAPLFPEHAKGCVLEIGPGSGVLLRYLDASQINTMYGAEPTTEFYPELRENVKRAGLEDKFHILKSGGEAESLIPVLNKLGLLNDSREAVFDTIICVRVLCSVPNQKQSIEQLYRLLKPGGYVIILEHVANPWPASSGHMLGWAIQRLIHTLGWSYFMGDCDLTRDTETLLMHAADVDGGWAGDPKLYRRGDDTPIPWIHGVLHKK